MYSFDSYTDTDYKYESIQTADSYYEDDDSLVINDLDDMEESVDDFLDELFDVSRKGEDISFPQTRI